MVDINYRNLPAPIGFTIDVDGLELWDYVPDPETHEGPTPKLNYVFRSGSLDIIYVELPPGTKLPWHTHEPHTAQVYYVTEGKIKTNYKDNCGNTHSVVGDAEDNEFIYLPAGAHNQLENPGNKTAKIFSYKEGGGAVVGRLEHILGDPSKHYDPKNIPSAGLDILPRKGHIFSMQEDIVEEW